MNPFCTSQELYKRLKTFGFKKTLPTNTPSYDEVFYWLRDIYLLLITISDRSGISRKFIYQITLLHTNEVLYQSGSVFGAIDPNKQVEFLEYRDAQEHSILTALTFFEK